MPFSSLTGAQQILVRLVMTGGPQYEAQMIKAGLATRAMSRDTVALDKAMKNATHRTWLQNQALFTMRRYLFYGTLGITGLALGVAKLGLNFFNTMQQAKVAFSSFLPPGQVADELQTLYLLAAKTPFTFPDITLAVRRMEPFVQNLQMTNTLVGDISNSLSAMGNATGVAMQRASLALSHMFAIGRLTGQVLYQLARDNIPMQLALQRYYHKTGLEIKEMVSQGVVSAQDAAKALHNLILTDPRFKNAAKEQAKTLTGAWLTFKDLLAMAAGTSQTKMFQGFTNVLNSLNKALINMASAKKPLTLTTFVELIDKKLTPTTHALINTWLFLQGVLKSLVIGFYLFFKALNLILWPFGKLLNTWGAAGKFAKGLGYAVGILVGAFLAFFLLVLPLTLAMEAFRFVLWGLKGAFAAVSLVMKTQKLIMGTEGAAGLIGRWKEWARASGDVWNAEKRMYEQGTKNNGLLAKMSRRVLDFAGVLSGPFVKAWGRTRIAINGAAKAMWGFAIAEAAALGWIALAIAIAAVLVILYFKWKWFHDLVNRTAKWIWDHAYLVAAALYIMFAPLAPVLLVAKLIIDHLRTIKKLINDVKSGIGKGWDWAGKTIKSTAKFSAQTGAFLVGSGKLPGHQFGGIVQGPIGQPQLVVAHGGERVVPVAQVQQQRIMGNDRPIVVQVMLDRKVLAQAVARANQDHETRK